MDIRLPSLGEGADSGVVVSVLVKEGDTIQKDQTILELETDKAVGSIPASAGGVVEKVLVHVGDKISSGTVILRLADAPGAAAESPVTPATTIAAPPSPARATVPTPAARPVATAKRIAGLPVAASPTVRRIAAQLGLDLAEVPASGRGGRVELEDLRAYIEQLKALAAAAAESGAPKARPRPRVDFSQFGPILKQPLSPLRQTLGRRMRESWTTVPRVTQFDEVDITELTRLRKRHAPAYERQGAKLTLTVFAIKAAVAALKKHPVLNASLDEEAEEIVLKQYYHIGIAVDTEHGLLVPVLRDADKKSWLDIARELEELAARARQRKLTGEEMTGGSFTISNQGGIGGAHFTPIVNLPEAAILGLGRGALKPAVVEGRVEPRWLLPVAISYDHRLIDGGTAARFTVDLATAFQSFTDQDVAI